MSNDIKYYVLHANYAEELNAQLIKQDILTSKRFRQVAELGCNECGIIQSNVQSKKIPRTNGWTIELKTNNGSNTMAHNTVRRNNLNKGFTGNNATKKNINTRLNYLECNATIFGKEMFLPDGHYLALSNSKEGTYKLLPIK